MSRYAASYRSRYLPAMSVSAIERLPDKERAVVIVATGAIEQHGPHLPVAVDSVMGQVWLSLALGLLAADFPCYVAPSLAIGKSNEHTGFPGTLSHSKKTMSALLEAIARQLRQWGFRNLAVLNTHGGNTSVLAYTLREIEATHGLRVRLLRPEIDWGLSDQERAYGFHAGELETSWMLAIAPEYVDVAAAVKEYPARLDAPGSLRPENAPATFAWATQDVSLTGVMGDAPAASAEKGRRWLELGSAAYARAITAFAEEVQNDLRNPATSR